MDSIIFIFRFLKRHEVYVIARPQLVSGFGEKIGLGDDGPADKQIKQRTMASSSQASNGFSVYSRIMVLIRKRFS